MLLPIDRWLMSEFGKLARSVPWGLREDLRSDVHCDAVCDRDRDSNSPAMRVLRRNQGKAS